MKSDFTKLVFASALLVPLYGAPAMAQDVGAYTDWDADGAAGINSEEFNTRFGGAGIYNKWDTDRDGALSEEEFNTGVYNGYDRDKSGAIEEPEFGDIGDDMGDEGFFDV